jgi:hypothetical protein
LNILYKEIVMNQINPSLLEPFKSDEKYTETASDGRELTHLRARVIENRLNEVLGLDWDHRIVPASSGKHYEILEYDTGLDMIVIVEITIGGSSRQGIGTKRIDETSGIIWADYAKMAENNGMFKAANKFGIGNDLYAGTNAPAQNDKPRSIRNPNEPATDKQVTTLRKMTNWRITPEVRSDLDILIARLDAGEPITKGEASAVMDSNQASKG